MELLCGCRVHQLVDEKMTYCMINQDFLLSFQSKNRLSLLPSFEGMLSIYRWVFSNLVHRSGLKKVYLIISAFLPFLTNDIIFFSIYSKVFSSIDNIEILRMIFVTCIFYYVIIFNNIYFKILKAYSCQTNTFRCKVFLNKLDFSNWKYFYIY